MLSGMTADFIHRGDGVWIVSIDVRVKRNIFLSSKDWYVADKIIGIGELENIYEQVKKAKKWIVKFI